MMEKEDILAISRKENKSRDLAELETALQAAASPLASVPVCAASYPFWLSGPRTRCFTVRGSFTSAFSERTIW